MSNPTPKTGRPATGSVYYEGGRWKARVTLPDGRRKAIPLPPWYTEEQARTKARELASAIAEQGVEGVSAVPMPKSETVSQWAARYVRHLDDRGLTSVGDVEGHVRNHVAPYVGDLEIRMVRREDVERVRDALDAKIKAGAWVDSNGRTRRFQWKTAANVWGTVKAMFDQAANAKPATGLRVRDDDPTDRVLPPERGETKDRQYLYPVEFMRLAPCASAREQARVEVGRRAMERGAGVEADGGLVERGHVPVEPERPSVEADAERGHARRESTRDAEAIERTFPRGTRPLRRRSPAAAGGADVASARRGCGAAR